MKQLNAKVSKAFPRPRAGTFIEATTLCCTCRTLNLDFPTFGWGLSLRPKAPPSGFPLPSFPHLRVGTFIEACEPRTASRHAGQFLLLWAGIFSAILSMNREISRRLLSPVLETTMVSRTGLFSLKHEDTLDAASTADSSCRLSESEMTKSDARNL